ncbi:preprotein translocase subunit SecE [Oceanobacillus senegalensis]|uniref:preprotein translocase subunit SecE n=1 Tax=Oceanobacillus senegalensis TaxID=1936063 RepID=UPI001FEB6062|nr:preprotein translocase subunit SecE [Oceanobacillus senegalensis]
MNPTAHLVEFGGTTLIKFLKDVSKEMKKVSWPKGKELTNYTIIVISSVVFMAIFFFVVDQIISAGLNLL